MDNMIDPSNEKILSLQLNQMRYFPETMKKQEEDKPVLLFTSPTCPYCSMVREYLKNKKLKVIEIDVTRDRENADKMVASSGSRSVPQVYIKNKWVIGFDKRRLDMILEQ